MKKIFTLLVGLTVFAASVWASFILVDKIYYDFDDTNLTATVTYQGGTAGEDPNQYVGEITIPDSVTYNDHRYAVTAIGDKAFYNSIALNSVVIPEGVTSIGDEAFAKCPLLNYVTVPNSVTTVGTTPFLDSEKMEDLVYNAHIFIYLLVSYGGDFAIPEGIEQIASGAFLACHHLTGVKIPNSVTTIDSRAFEWCNQLTSISCAAVIPPTCGEGVFGHVDQANCKLYVPDNSLEAYRSADQWKEFDIRAMTEGIEEAESKESRAKSQKILRDGQLLIIRNNEIYKQQA